MQTRWLVGDFNEKELFQLQLKAGENMSLQAGAQSDQGFGT